MSRGILPQSESDWGGFLLTFELGLISLSLKSTPSSCFIMSRRGERADFGRSVQGPLPSLLLRLFFLKTNQDNRRQDRARQDKIGQGRPRQDKTGQVKAAQDKTGQDKTGPDPNVKRNLSPVWRGPDLPRGPNLVLIDSFMNL